MSVAGLFLSIAVGDDDRTRPLVDGIVQIDGTDPVFMLPEPAKIVFRAFRHAEFDICRLPLLSFALKTAQGTNPYVGVPVVPSRAVRHHAIYVRRDRGIASPGDLRGRRIGTPEYQLTARVWARALLEEDYGAKPSDVIWARAGINEPGRVENIAAQSTPSLPPAAFIRGARDIGWLFSDPRRRPRRISAAPASFPSCTGSAAAVACASKILGSRMPS